MDQELEKETELANKRGSLRQNSTKSNITVRIDGFEDKAAYIQDVSRTGVRFHSSSCLPCGSTIEMKAEDNSDLRPCKARIMRQWVVEDELSSGFEYGLRFTDDMNEIRHEWYLSLRKAA